LLNVVIQGLLSVKESAYVFFRKRQGHLRLFLIAALLADFVDQMIFGEEKGLIGIYTRLPPFNWDTPQYAVFKTVRPFTIVLGTLTGLFLLKKIMRLRDTTVIIIGIISMSLYALMVGLAQSSWLLYTSLAPGCLHGLLNPLTYAFMARIVSADEAGKNFAVVSIVEQLAVVVQSVVFQSVYIATLNWYQGFVWMLLAGIGLLSAFSFSIIHFMAKREM
jgi:hypothetical protein